MTKYRTINDGYFDFLQYQTNHRFLFWTFNIWHDVPKPYYDDIYGTFNIMRFDGVVICNEHELKQFAEKWPNIKDYMVHYKKEQQKLVNKYRKKNQERTIRRGTTKEFVMKSDENNL